ncbi:MAG TPA: hypothetical protein VIR32_07850, partial [Lachnospiraceae bacterium]
KTKCEKLITNKGYSTVYSILLDDLFKHPIVSKNNLTDILGVSYPTVSKMVDDFCADNILQDVTPDQKRNKRYVFSAYMEILNRGTEL